MAADEPRRPASGEPYEFIGAVIGRSHIGRKCVFMDLVKLDEARFTAGEVKREAVVHLVGDHVARPVPLTVADIMRDLVEGTPEYHSVFAALSDDSLDADGFEAFTASLTTPGEISKLRIGDILRVRARELVGQPPRVVRDITMKRGNAISVVLLREGEKSRPGDFGDKWNLPEQRAPKQGTPRRHNHRFRVFAEWCHATFFPSHDTAAAARDGSTQGPRVLDIAGGSGKLAEAFRKLGFSALVVDPRPAFLSRRKKTSETVVKDVAPDQAGDADDTPPSDTTAPFACIREFFDFDKQREAVMSTDLLVGLHCDGAVNEIIRAAAATQKHFAICACCVFPKTYPRTLASGQPVILREDLNKWIAEEVQRQGFTGTIGSVTLAFDGANEVVYGIAAKPTAAE